MRERVYNVDINKRIYEVPKYKQYDNDILYNIRLIENGVNIDLSGCDIIAFFKRSDSKIFQKSCSIKGDIVSTTLDNNILAIPGNVVVEFKIYKNTQIITTFLINIDVESSINTNEAITKNPEWDIIQEVLSINSGQVQKYLDEVEKEVNNRFNVLSSEKQLDSEVVDARKGRRSLREFNDDIESRVNILTVEKINVKDFGAKGDGITDDTQAIQNAILDARNKNATVFIPYGVYIVSSGIEVFESTNICGAGRTIIKVKDNSTIPYVFFNSAVSSTYVHHIVIENLILMGNKENNAKAGGINLKSTYNSKVKNCRIIKFSENAISITGEALGDVRSNTNYVIDCTIYDNDGVGIFADGGAEDLHILGGDVGLSKKDNIRIFSPSTSISEVRAIWGSRTGNGITVAGDNAQISSCNIEGNNKCGIDIFESYCYVSNNKIYANSTAFKESSTGTLEYPNICINQGAKNTSIISNQIYGNLYEDSVNHCIVDRGLNAHVYSNYLNNNPSNINYTKNPIININPYHSDYNWIKTNIYGEVTSTQSIEANKSVILKFSKVRDFDNEFKLSGDNNVFVPNFNGDYMVSLNLRVTGDANALVRIIDSKSNAFYFEVANQGIINVSRIVNLKSDENYFLYIDSSKPISIVKDYSSVTIKKCM